MKRAPETSLYPPTPNENRPNELRTEMSFLHTFKGALWNLRRAVQGDVHGKAERLEKWESLSADQLAALQEERLRALLRHAYEHTPFYRERFEKCGVVENGRIHLDRFREIPLLDKHDLRTRSEALQSDDLHERTWRYNTSGGSTGEPVQFIQDHEYWEWSAAIKQHFNKWTDYRAGQPRVRLWGSERDLMVGDETLKTKLSRWVRNERCLNAFRMGTSQMRQFVDTINEVEPVQIIAYVESIYDLAQFIERKELSVHFPTAILATAGTLYDHVRDTLQRVFRAPVFNRYGSREVGDVACECDAHEGLHVSAPTHYVEILRSDGTPAEPGEVGEIVITLLTNHTMPLVRYRIGDVGAWASSECSCGRFWPLLEEVTGRVSDIFVNAQGETVHGEFFTHLFYGESWVQKFQVVQTAVDHVDVAVVPSDQSAAHHRRYEQQVERIRTDIQSAMGAECEVEFHFQEEIPPTDSGKYRYTVSHVDRRGRP